MVTCRLLLLLLLATLSLGQAQPDASNNIPGHEDWYVVEPEPTNNEQHTKPVPTTTKPETMSESDDDELKKIKEESVTTDENSEAATRILSLLAAALRNRPAEDLEELRLRLQQALQQQGQLAGLDPLAPGERSLENPLTMRQHGLLDSLALRRGLLEGRVLRQGLLADEVLGRGLLGGQAWRSGRQEELVYGRRSQELGLLERGLMLQRPRWEEANGRVAALAMVRRVAPYTLGKVLTTGRVCHSCRRVRVPGVNRRRVAPAVRRRQP